MFEWDEQKRLVNIGKHNLDFFRATVLFDGRPAFTSLSAQSEELRFVTVGMIDFQFFAVVWTWRQNTRRIISFRRARDGEKREYREIYP
jgi:uncharacterized protein